jgi:hypothetical protein
VNYQVTGANLQTFVNNSSGNITGGNIISTGAVSASGNVSGNYILGNGSLLTGIPAQYGNANVAAYLPTFSGNLAGGNAIITNSVSAAAFSGSGAALTNLPGANVVGAVATATFANTATTATTATSATTAGTVTTAAQPNITSVGTLTSLSSSGNITASGNVSANYFVGNGSALTGIVAVSTYNDANVAAFLPTYTGAMTAMTGNVTTTGNVSAAFVKGNGAALTGIVSSIQAGSGISISGATGTVTITNNNPTPYTNANATALLASFGSNTISTTGNITGGNIAGTHLGNGSALTGIVNSVAAGTGIVVSGSTGNVTISATAGAAAVIATGSNFANTAAGSGKMWINGGNSTGTYNIGGYAANILLITNGAGNCAIALTDGGQINLTAPGNINLNNASYTNTGDLFSQDIVASSTIRANDQIRSLASTTPPFRGAQQTKTGGSAGETGEIAWDANYIYVCTAFNTWKRVALSSF